MNEQDKTEAQRQAGMLKNSLDDLMDQARVVRHDAAHPADPRVQVIREKIKELEQK